MTRMKLALIFGGVAVAAGAAGCALGVLLAPASGDETRRRLAWRTEEQWRSVARVLERAAERAREEVENRKKRIIGAA